MRNTLFVSLTSAILGLALPPSASAADLSANTGSLKDPIAAPAYNWSGFYAGANIGGAWSTTTLTDETAAAHWTPGGTGFIGGAQIGYNVQTGNFVYGIEGDFDWTTFAGTTRPLSTSLGVIEASTTKDWIATVAGRLGIASDNLLFYSKFGAGWIQESAALSTAGGGAILSGSRTTSGWLAGGGIEYAFASNWTGKLEYDYLGLSNTTTLSPSVVNVSHDIQMLKVGVNYEFGERAPAAAKSSPSGASGEDTEALAKKSQNPIADLISLPSQNNFNFNTGPFNRTQYINNIQPVVPLHLTPDWNIVSRTIVPVVSQPDPARDSSTGGVGDITQSLFLSPTNPGDLIWGIGPVYTMPAASSPILGTGKVLVGPTIVALVEPGHWVIGVLANNQWSVAGDPHRPSVNELLVQPFINYNMKDGWYLTSGPIITADWMASSSQRWTLPVGGGFGRVFKIDKQPINATLQAYYNVLHPDGAADWQLRLEVTLLFPE
jgi:opacity protein-like surface antigen